MSETSQVLFKFFLSLLLTIQDTDKFCRSKFYSLTRFALCTMQHVTILRKKVHIMTEVRFLWSKNKYKYSYIYTTNFIWGSPDSEVSYWSTQGYNSMYCCNRYFYLQCTLWMEEKILVFWDIMSCQLLYGSQCFKEACCLHLQENYKDRASKILQDRYPWRGKKLLLMMSYPKTGHFISIAMTTSKITNKRVIIMRRAIHNFECISL